jgi:uncharacterized lipoprotein YddW (UPF0748 family)
MANPKKTGGGCANIPMSLILLILGGGYWWLFPQGNGGKLLAQVQAFLPPMVESTPNAPAPVSMTLPRSSPSPQRPKVLSPQASIAPPKPLPQSSVPAAANRQPLRGIYLSRYLATNNASEETIRSRVRYYKAQGFNTIIQGVWGNGCTMYVSQVMQRQLGYESCPNQFQAKWLDWMIDESHIQGMQVHAYFEKGIKLDKNSPVFNRAIERKWIVPGVDRTYPGVEHYVLDVEMAEVGQFFQQISAEFVTRYPKIDAVQWDDYLGYYADLPGQVDRTARLSQFVLKMRAEIKRVNPAVSFDLCHHNPYWAKRYFAADWENWKLDRAFIQVYNDRNFQEEMGYVEQYGGVAIADTQLARLKDLVKNPKIRNIFIFPTQGDPEKAAAAYKDAMGKVN